MRTLNKLERQIIELDRRIIDRRFKTYKGPRSQIAHLNPIAPNYSKIGKTLRAIWAIWISIMSAWAYRLKFKEPPKSKENSFCEKHVTLIITLIILINIFFI